MWRARKVWVEGGGRGGMIQRKKTERKIERRSGLQFVLIKKDREA